MPGTTARRPLIAGVAGALVTLGLVTVAAPSTPASAASAGQKTITVFLKAPHAAALTRLSHTPIRSRSRRLATLRSLVPSTQDRRTTVDRLRTAGFAVESQTAWSVTATGPADTVSDLFGTRPAAGANPTPAQFRAAIGPLPRTPKALRSLVSGVYPTRSGPAAFSHHDLVGRDIRRADTPAGGKASTGRHDGRVTIATLQLARFNASDLTHYANHAGLADPVGAGRYVPVQVDGGATAPGPNDTGDVEVALDQESILSTAPSANQHPYFAPNTGAGFGDVFAHVYDDVTGNAQATQPDANITALSVSWGACETLQGSDTIAAYEPVVASLVAAGVTIFASSGDDGIYDCRSLSGTGQDNSQADVDYPASSPEVVAVGGTNLSSKKRRVNTGRNWTEKTWTCTSPVTCQNTISGTGGSGGGASGSAYNKTSVNGTGDFRGFAKPVWQRRTIHARPYGRSRRRLVPDIAADGDPATGFVLYTSDPQINGYAQVGGTSLSAPLSAAQLTNTLADAHRHHGVGDIHGALYSGYKKTHTRRVTNRHRAFRDVTKGRNGASGDKGADPSVYAAKGYDTTTGLGGVLWKALRPYLFEKDAPKPVAHVHLLAKTGPHRFAVARWHTKAGKDVDVISTTRVSITRVGATSPLKSFRAGRGHARFRVKRGNVYRVTLVAVDIAGHRSSKKVKRLRFP